MKEHVNFYEDLAEATKRLDGSVVKYDGDFYYVLCVTNHKEDGIFRIYLDPLKALWHPTHSDVPYNIPQVVRGVEMDKYLANTEGCPILRKTLNSKLFNRFRPFPIGMVNTSGNVVYVERTPVRHTQQGLTSQMLRGKRLDIRPVHRDEHIDIYTPGLYDTLMGEYPSFDECCLALTDPSILNTGAAFHRDFAVVRGPASSLFLAYKEDIVGFLPFSDDSCVVLAKEFKYLEELVDSLGIFEIIRGALS